MSPLPLFAAAILVFLTGCRDQGIEKMGVWSEPQEMSKSSDSLDTSFTLFRWNGSLLLAGGDAGTYSARTLQEDGTSWKTMTTADSGWKPMCTEQAGNRFLNSWATLWSNSLDARFSVGSLSPDGRFAVESSGALSLSKERLFPNARPNLELNDGNKRPSQIGFPGGIVEDAQIRIPYSVTGIPIERKGRQVGLRADLAVSANGVFASSDGGSTWRIEPISGNYAESPVMCRTRGFYYYFAKAGLGGIEPYELWHSRCAVETSSWRSTETINKSVARKLSERLHAVAEEDTVHLCWLDARNENTRLSLARPRVENYEVAYSRRRDSESGWSKEVILSKGLRWAYAPSMSVEGNNVVVAWAGAKSDKEGRNEWNASDIFYALSKDGGNTWTKPIQVTDGFKVGITSGRPQIAIHKGVIHLFYIQGKTTYKETSPGLVKLNQPPWPIYYQRRSLLD